MVAAPSYVGETVTGRCPRCGVFREIPDPAAGFETTGKCSDCDSMVDWDVWDGPVRPI